ncbi:MBL fold metallo-hydrolase [Dyadobacter sp. NIV53]|uniref:MBL fold metallo-hydrolase n=1 Tax=Dyadobacter sp. NIV53 TaxID=2861765 RepID=UPI001C88CA2E|nr:3',5'-cyclic-nucleotide phosphodiesterase [Dyadobacter sp. NIV53]
MIRFISAVFLFSQLFFSISFAQSAFRVVPLGVKGGIQEGNLSAYMIAPSGSEAYICLDAGTLNTGIRKAIENGAFSVSEDAVLKNYIKGYLISHAHLDHISGLIINSADDTTKSIYAFPNTLETIRNHYFNWESWPNFGNEGNGFLLNKYTYKPLIEGKELKIEQTEMSVKAYKLSHSNPYESAAFLIRTGDAYVLYFGDTGPDEVEKTDHIQAIWKDISPLIKAGKLKGVFLEVSYPNEQPDNKLYGHLTPKWLMKEMNKLSELAGKENMQKLNIIITHIKPAGNNEEKIRAQLRENNLLRLKLVIPEQGVGFGL